MKATNVENLRIGDIIYQDGDFLQVAKVYENYNIMIIFIDKTKIVYKPNTMVTICEEY